MIRKHKDKKQDSAETAVAGQKAVIFSSVPSDDTNYRRKAALLIGIPIGGAVVLPIAGSLMALSGNMDFVRVIGSIFLSLTGPLLFLIVPICIVLGCYTLVKKK